MFRILLISLALACSQFHLLARPQQVGLNADQIEKNAIQAGWAQPIVTQVLDLVLKPEKTTSKTPASSAGEDPSVPIYTECSSVRCNGVVCGASVGRRLGTAI
jgi:hypothetical protein